MKVERYSESGKVMVLVLTIIMTVGLLFLGGGVYYFSKTVNDIFNQNEELKIALATLTKEEQIGYAKVIRQDKHKDNIYTTIKFVETSRNNKLKTVLEKEYTLKGDVVYFDALIVTFPGDMVKDGKERLKCMQKAEQFTEITKCKIPFSYSSEAAFF